MVAVGHLLHPCCDIGLVERQLHLLVDMPLSRQPLLQLIGKRSRLRLNLAKCYAECRIAIILHIKHRAAGASRRRAIRSRRLTRRGGQVTDHR